MVVCWYVKLSSSNPRPEILPEQDSIAANVIVTCIKEVSRKLMALEGNITGYAVFYVSTIVMHISFCILD